MTHLGNPNSRTGATAAEVPQKSQTDWKICASAFQRSGAHLKRKAAHSLKYSTFLIKRLKQSCVRLAYIAVG